MKTLFCIILVICGLTACSSSHFIFKNNSFADLENLKLSEAIKYDKKLKSKDVTPDHLIKIGESIYPNKNGFILATPTAFERLEGNDFKLKVDYFYTPEDSSVKVILYQWDLFSNNSELTEREIQVKYQKFQNKFDYLRSELMKELGAPSSIEINSIISKSNFRDGVKWMNGNGLNAYLFMLGNDGNKFRQIRLAVYKE